MKPGDLGGVAIEYLMAARHDDIAASERARDALAQLTSSELRDGLPDDRHKSAFWIDVYNGAVMRQPEIRLDTWRSRLTFLRRTVISIAGQPLTLDTIEHGILRRSRPKLGLGFLSDPFPSRFERAHRVDRVDPRIHFALNCAAASCPPIAAYDADHIDEQLDLATRAYLGANVELDGDGIRVPQIFLWYPGDFGGPPGIRSFLREHGVEGAGRRLRFAAYDWTPSPGIWAPEPGMGAPGSRSRTSDPEADAAAATTGTGSA